MKLIEADKVKQAIKDYWKAQVDRAPIPKSTEEYNAYVNCLDAILERNDGLLKAIDELPPAEPDTTTHDSIPAETGKNDGDRTSGDCISRQAAIDEIHEDAEWLASQGSDWQVERMERDKSILMSLPSVQPDDDRLERCRFEYANACKIVTYPTPDTTKKDINDAYAVVRALNPIFGEEGF